MITAIYARFGQIFDMDCMSIDSAKEVLQGIEDAGDGYAIGVFDGYLLTLHLPNNMDIAGTDAETVKKEKIASLSELGLKPNKIIFYDQSV